MIHPHTEIEYINKTVGYGLIATQPIPAGTITWALDDLDREFTPEQFKTMLPIYQNILETYTYRNNKGNLVLCWDHGKFVNHSFNSNCLTTAYDFEIAIRDIQPGEELTDDYGYLNISEPFEGIDEGTHRKIVYPDDLLNYHHIWDQQLKNVFHHIVEVAQPLRPFLSENLWQKVQRISAKQEEMTSIVKNYFPQ